MYCENNQVFDFPEGLLDDLYQGRIVLFAGAGVSTESLVVKGLRFAEQLQQWLGLSDSSGLGFPALLERFCSQRNGKLLFIQKLVEYSRMLESFPETYSLATRFHSELATIRMIDTIVTTNWDVYFERECGATPLVCDSDFAFWELPGRKVLKIHGSIRSPASIVATASDYAQVYKSLQGGVLGASLKQLLATKTLVFVGYSITDPDFVKLYKMVGRSLGPYLRKAYCVTLDSGVETRIRRLGIEPIFTDATYFLECLKAHAIEAGEMLEDSGFVLAEIFLDVLIDTHRVTSSKFPATKYPCVIYCLSYQDGLTHALSRMLNTYKTGYYSCRGQIMLALGTSEGLRQERLRARDYWNVAYIEGYMRGLSFLLVPENDRLTIPMHYCFGYNQDIKSTRQFGRILKKAENYHRAAFKRAVLLTKDRGSSIVLHHPPILPSAT